MSKLRILSALFLVVFFLPGIKVEAQEARARYEIMKMIRKDKFDLVLPGAMSVLIFEIPFLRQPVLSFLQTVVMRGLNVQFWARVEETRNSTAYQAQKMIWELLSLNVIPSGLLSICRRIFPLLTG